jgi:hypothetical protein
MAESLIMQRGENESDEDFADRIAKYIKKAQDGQREQHSYDFEDK